MAHQIPGQTRNGEDFMKLSTCHPARRRASALFILPLQPIIPTPVENAGQSYDIEIVLQGVKP
jgi:hypothetical protein